MQKLHILSKICIAVYIFHEELSICNCYYFSRIVYIYIFIAKAAYIFQDIYSSIHFFKKNCQYIAAYCQYITVYIFQELSAIYSIHKLHTGCIPAEELKFVMTNLPGEVHPHHHHHHHHHQCCHCVPHYR